MILSLSVSGNPVSRCLLAFNLPVVRLVRLMRGVCVCVCLFASVDCGNYYIYEANRGSGNGDDDDDDINDKILKILYSSA